MLICLKSLQYVQFWRISDCISQDEKIKGHGVVNEGVVSTRLGLKGILI
jgi:dihydroorotase